MENYGANSAETIFRSYYIFPWQVTHTFRDSKVTDCPSLSSCSYGAVRWLHSAPSTSSAVSSCSTSLTMSSFRPSPCPMDRFGCWTCRTPHFRTSVRSRSIRWSSSISAVLLFRASREITCRAWNFWTFQAAPLLSLSAALPLQTSPISTYVHHPFIQQTIDSMTR